MKRMRFADELIIGILAEHEADHGAYLNAKFTTSTQEAMVPPLTHSKRHSRLLIRVTLRDISRFTSSDMQRCSFRRCDKTQSAQT